jgi:hypothetical protein
MTASPSSAVREARGVAVRSDESALTVDLDDGRSITVPILWFPRLAEGTPAERANWRFIGDGEGIHWPGLDEDIKVQHLLEGRGSNESNASLKRWIEERKQAGKKA